MRKNYGAAVAGAAAGLANGLFGAGGGMLLLPLLERLTDLDSREQFASSVCIILPLCLAVAVYEGEFAGALFGAVSGLLWDYTAGRTVGMLALELLLLCFALSVLVQVYLQGSTWNFALIGTGTALVVL